MGTFTVKFKGVQSSPVVIRGGRCRWATGKGLCAAVICGETGDILLLLPPPLTLGTLRIGVVAGEAGGVHILSGLSAWQLPGMNGMPELLVNWVQAVEEVTACSERGLEGMVSDGDGGCCGGGTNCEGDGGCCGGTNCEAEFWLAVTEMGLNWLVMFVLLPSAFSWAVIFIMAVLSRDDIGNNDGITRVVAGNVTASGVNDNFRCGCCGCGDGGSCGSITGKRGGCSEACTDDVMEANGAGSCICTGMPTIPGMRCMACGFLVVLPPGDVIAPRRLRPRRTRGMRKPVEGYCVGIGG